MTSGLKTVIFPVTDLPAATRLYAALLGTEPVMNEPYYVQFSAAGQDIGLDPNGHASGMAGPVAYWHVEDIELAVKGLLAAGATEHQPVRSVGGTRRIASVTDPDGNVLGVLQP